MRVPPLGCSCLKKKGHNCVKKWRITSPTGMSSLLKVNNYSGFQVNIFRNNRDIRLHLENSKSKKEHNFVKKWRITSPTGMGSPFDSEQLF